MPSERKPNKIVFGETVLIDLTGDTVTLSQLGAGYTAHTCDGEVITGSATVVDRTFTDAEIDAMFNNW